MAADAAGGRRALGPAGVCALVVAAAAACAPRAGLVLPSGTPQPSPVAAARYAEASIACRDVRGMSAEVAVSGRLGGQRVRGRLLVGLERGGRLRLEALAPFGEPVFVLVADRGPATLLLPRDRRVLDGVEVPDVLDALAGVGVAADDLLAMLAGCVATGEATDGALLDSTAVVRVGERARAFVGDGGRPGRIVMGEITGGAAPLVIGYSAFAADGRPREVRLERAGPAAPSMLLLRLSQLEYDQPLPPDAFAVRLPGQVRPLTLDELRRSSPLAAR